VGVRVPPRAPTKQDNPARGCVVYGQTEK